MENKYVINWEKYASLARQAAAEGAVLLKNDDQALPLKKETISVFGRIQFHYYKSGTGSGGLVNAKYVVGITDALLEEENLSVNEELAEVYRSWIAEHPFDQGSGWAQEPWCQEEMPLEEKLVEEAAAKSDAAVIVIGRTAGEDRDASAEKGSYLLTDLEEDMLSKVCRAFERVIVVLNVGNIIDMKWVDKYRPSAVIYTWQGGQEGGHSVADVLTGRVNPCGKLADTIAHDISDYPSTENFGGDTFDLYTEDIYVGYRYFDSFGKAPAYSFGHGLSYTDFALETGKPSFDGNNVTLQVTITNTGKRAGKETAQLYLHAPEGKLEKPYRVLAAFEKTKELKPGEKELLALTACASDFASFDEETGSYLLEAGTYEVYCGNSLAKAVLAGCFTVGKTETLRTVERVCRPVEEFKRLNRENGTAEAVSQLVDLDQRIRVRAPRPSYQPLPLKKHTGKKIIYAQVKENPGLMDEFVSQMSDKELCRMNVCGGSNWYLPWQNGEAGKTNVIKKYKMPRMLVSDGNTGINVKKKNIGMPCSASIAATFNKELAYRVGSVIAKESKAQNIYQNLGPGMNIHRNVLNGRHPEYFSEDPYLAGMMAGMHAKGMEDNGVGSCYKHMFCNNSDTSRKGSHSIVSERALREIYFRVFEVAIAVQKPSAVMTSYNAVNGIYPAENADVIQKLIRGEWGIDGMVMTDWGTYDTVDAVEMVKAGNCWLTEGSKKYSRLLEQAVKEGRLSRAVLERNVRSVISTMLKRV